MADKRPHLHVEFLMLPVQNMAESEKAGRPIYKDIEHCRIRWAGDNKKELFAPAHEKTEFDREQGRYITWAEKFPEHYKLFKQNQDQSSINGTPLSEAPFLTEAKRAELRALNVHSVESLAGLDGANLARLGMGARELKNKAVAWIEQAGAGAGLSKLAEENDTLKAQMAEMQAQMAQLLGGQEADISGSPFADWDDETIRVWIRENGGTEPHPSCKHQTLVAKADILNKSLKKAA
jgi:hypothetical protein